MTGFNMKGLTLLEVLIASAVAAIVAAFLIGILVNNSGTFYKERSIIAEGLGLNDVMAEIDNYIRQASGVATGYPESSPTYITGVDTLVLKLPSYDQFGPLSDLYDYAVISRDLTQVKVLRLRVFPQSQSQRRTEDLVLTAILESVQFNYQDKNGNSVSPSLATSIESNLTLLYKTGLVGSNRTSKILTTLKNAGG